MDIPAGGADTPEKSSTAPSDAPIIDEAAYPPPMQAWYCVSILALAVMINFLDRGILNLLVEPIKADLNLSDVQMSLIMGFAFTFFYAILACQWRALSTATAANTSCPLASQSGA